MHIADGALSTEVMVVTNVAAVAAVGGSLRAIDYERVPRIGVLAAVFFLASFIHIKIGPSSVHLLLNGLLGLLLGWAALPALAVALFLQAILFGYGGLTSLGANILVMGLPALAVGWLFGRPCRQANGPGTAGLWGGLAGGLAVLLACFAMMGALHLSRPQAYRLAIRALLLAHIPVIVVEAAVVGAAASLLHRVRPDLLAPPFAHDEAETQ